MAKLQDFIKKYQGKFASYPTGLYRGQCVSLVKRWLEFNDWPMRKGNAIDWVKNGDGKVYKYIPNQIWTVPKPGDLAIFSVGKYGHIGIVVSANLMSMQVFNQNWPHGNTTDPAVISTFNYRNPKCVGFLRKT